MNKKRNTLFLYECLIRELTKSVMEGDCEKKKYISSLIKEHFSVGKVLHEDWKLHKSLLNLHKNSQIAEKILNEVKRIYGFVNQQLLFDEQSKLIKKMNTMFGSKIFSTFLPNYRTIATIHQILNGKNLSPKKRIMLEQELLEGGEVLKEDNKYEPVSKLAFKKFIEKYNSHYSSLLPEQKELLQKYITTDKNKAELKYFLNEEVGRLKTVVSNSFNLTEIKEDQEMNKNTQQVLKLLESFSQKPVDFEMIGNVLKIQQLVKEIQED